MCEMWLNKFIFIAASRTTHTRFYTCPLCRHKRHIALSLTLTLALSLSHTLCFQSRAKNSIIKPILPRFLSKWLTALQRVGLVDASVLEARKMLLPGLVHDPQLAVLEVRALEAPVSEEDAPARARVLVSLRLAWAKSSQRVWG